MNTIISIHNVWCERILNKEKPFEFRHSVGKDIEVGDTVYMYETYFKKGRKKVVGEFTIKAIDTIDTNKTKLGCYRFLKIYADLVLKDKTISELLERAYKIDLKDYRNDYVLYSLFVPEEFEYMEKHSEPMPSDMETKYIKYCDKNYTAAKDKATKLMEDCDNWLRYLGYYNEYDESDYSYMISIDNPIRYNNPIDISEFELRNGTKLKKAPQSWCYTTRTSS